MWNRCWPMATEPQTLPSQELCRWEPGKWETAYWRPWSAADDPPTPICSSAVLKGTAAVVSSSAPETSGNVSRGHSRFLSPPNRFPRLLCAWISVDLAVASAVFLVSSLAVIFFGTRLAVYGDALASLTGLGRLFVGSILLALATSLPELSTKYIRRAPRPAQSRPGRGQRAGRQHAQHVDLLPCGFIFWRKAVPAARRS